MLAGMYAQVRFKVNQPSHHHPAVQHPDHACRRPAGRRSGQRCGAHAQVTLGRDFGQQIEIIAGLDEKEQWLPTRPTSCAKAWLSRRLHRNRKNERTG